MKQAKVLVDSVPRKQKIEAGPTFHAVREVEHLAEEADDVYSMCTVWTARKVTDEVI